MFARGKKFVATRSNVGNRLCFGNSRVMLNREMKSCAHARDEGIRIVRRGDRDQILIITNTLY